VRGYVDPFYVSPEWRKKRTEILKQDRYECQHCKTRGRYKRANTVHHVCHLDCRPDLALCDEYADADGGTHRQLVSLCKECHEREHAHLKQRKVSPPLTEERW
jgi:5-methylcytosine-specific restriction endonuclease McrA